MGWLSACTVETCVVVCERPVEFAMETAPVQIPDDVILLWSMIGRIQTPLLTAFFDLTTSALAGMSCFTSPGAIITTKTGAHRVRLVFKLDEIDEL